MGLNPSKGNMYEWVNYTWNTIKGKCPHDCLYCYMKHWGELKPVRFDKEELKTDLGSNNVIFVGSSCDMFAYDIKGEWMIQTLERCCKYPNNTYLFQSKNPRDFTGFASFMPEDIRLCTTIETNRWYPEVMKNSPGPIERGIHFAKIPIEDKYITIEPIMDFDLKELVELVHACCPQQVNIGADSGNNNLPEPPKEKIFELIKELEFFTTVKQKSNLNRLLK